MKITVLNGSPKVDKSVTMQYVNYIKKRNSDREYKVFNIGRDIKKIEKKPELFKEIIEEINNSDGILWCTPVYVLLVPSQLKRFIELVLERGVEKAFKGKYATTITTSVHFYDHTAHNYLHAVSEDLGMKYVEGYSAEMYDLLKPEERANLLNFANDFFDFIEEKRPTVKTYQPVSYKVSEYLPGKVKNVPNEGKWKIVLLTDSDTKDTNLNRMINVFVESIPNDVEVLNLNDVDIKGGCLGCIRCGYEGVCVYKDGMMDFYNGKLLPADAVIIAGSIKDRYLSSRWKMFFDRGFFNGHRPVLAGKQLAGIISGPLRQIPNLRQVLGASAGVSRANGVGSVTDEYKDSEYITSLLVSLANQLVAALDENKNRPATFLGVGGHKVLRDLVYSLKGVFKADHEYYRAHDLYDFPQRDVKSRAQNFFLSSVMSIPPARKQIYGDINKYSIRPLKQALRD